MKCSFLFGLVLLAPAGVLAQNPASPPAAPGQGQMTLYPQAEIQWKDGPPTLPKGVKMAVLEGDPAKPGMFTWAWGGGSTEPRRERSRPGRSATGRPAPATLPGSREKRFSSCTDRGRGPWSM